MEGNGRYRIHIRQKDPGIFVIHSAHIYTVYAYTLQHEEIENV